MEDGLKLCNLWLCFEFFVETFYLLEFQVSDLCPVPFQQGVNLGVSSEKAFPIVGCLDYVHITFCGDAFHAGYMTPTKESKHTDDSQKHNGKLSRTSTARIVIFNAIRPRK